MKRLFEGIIFISILLTLSVSCKYKGTPKPMGWFRIEFPEKEYVLLDSVMPYSFLYPKYAHIESDISPNSEPYWINLIFQNFNAIVHITYKNLDGNDIYEILDDVFRLTFNHLIKADDIPEHIFINDEHNVYGTVFEVKGNAASPLQFFATDSLKHFIRGALYFDSTPNRDSLSPVIDFITYDIFTLMETIRWKN